LNMQNSSRNPASHPSGVAEGAGRASSDVSDLRTLHAVRGDAGHSP
jgi:hypothetical protein